MDRRVLDLISTKFLTKKLSTEVELENLINNNLKDSLAVVSDEIMLKVRELREISSDISTWENIVTQLTKSKENNNKKKKIKMKENNLDKMKVLVSEFEADFTKFTEKGNKAAGTRARKALQDIRNLAKDIRTEISEAKKKTAA